MNKEKIDGYLWQVHYYIMKKSGVDAARVAMYPLFWYIDTGRASCEFLRLLLQKKPFVIGRVLMIDQSTDDTIKAIKKKIGFPL